MGITGLIPLLEEIKTTVKIEQFRGQTLAVDGHCWLHRAANSCAYELNMDVPTSVYITSFMHYVKLLRFHEVTPIIVFDGQPLPMKAKTNDERTANRKEKLSRAKYYAHKGDSWNASKYFRQAIHITPQMILTIIAELDKLRVQHIVAPYEADPQLTYLVNSGQADGVITEDSDLLAFGCRRIIFKMDREGEGTLIDFADIFTKPKLGMTRFTPTMFRTMCILSGCDYLANLPGTGLKTARDLVSRYRTLKQIMAKLRLTKKTPEMDLYHESFPKAEAGFLYQFVFDPSSRTYCRLNPLPAGIDVEHLSMLGESPQNKDIDILRSNQAIHIDYAQNFLDADKENVDPFVDDDDDEFGNFNANELLQVEAILKTVESKLPKAEKRSAGAALQNLTNAKSIPLSQAMKKSAAVNKHTSFLLPVDTTVPLIPEPIKHNMPARDIAQLISRVISKNDPIARKIREEQLHKEFVPLMEHYQEPPLFVLKTCDISKEQMSIKYINKKRKGHVWVPPTPASRPKNRRL